MEMLCHYMSLHFPVVKSVATTLSQPVSRASLLARLLASQVWSSVQQLIFLCRTGIHVEQKSGRQHVAACLQG